MAANQTEWNGMYAVLPLILKLAKPKEGERLDSIGRTWTELWSKQSTAAKKSGVVVRTSRQAKAQRRLAGRGGPSSWHLSSQARRSAAPVL